MASFIVSTEKKPEKSEQTSSFVISRSPPIDINNTAIEVHTGIYFTDNEYSDLSQSEYNGYISDNNIENSKKSDISELLFGDLEIDEEEKIGGWETNEYFEV